jgi:tetratricopeptide (TPR) repeat protein
MNNMAVTNMMARRYRDAIPLLIDMLDPATALLGPRHPQTLTNLNNLAAAYKLTGQNQEALPLYEKVFALRKETLGLDHLDTLISTINLAQAYRAAGRLADAIRLGEEAVSRTSASLPSDHPTASTALFSLGSMYVEAGRPEKAVPLLERSLARRMQKLGSRHRQTLDTIAELAWAHAKAGRFADARTQYRALLDHYHNELQAATRSAPLEETAARLASLCSTLGDYLLSQREFEDAEALLRDSMAVRERMSSDDWRTFNARALLGAALLGQGKHAEAEPLLLAGYEGMDRRRVTIPPEGRKYLISAAQRLLELSRALNRADDEARWRQTVDALQNENSAIKAPEPDGEN